MASLCSLRGRDVFCFQNSIFALAICKFLLANTSGCASIAAATTQPTLPLSRFYSYIPAVGANAVAAGVAATDGSIGYAVLAVALDMNNYIAAMVNKAGVVVQPTTDSITYAAVELGTTALARTTLVSDLTDGTGSGVWPITSMSYLLLDTVNSVSTCRAREAVVNFWLWFYQSDTVTNLLATRDYARVPDIVMTSLNVINNIESEILCRGAAAYEASATSTRTISVPSSVSFITNLLTPLYTNQDGTASTTTWSTTTVTDQLAFSQLVNAEIDIAFFNPNNVDATMLQAARDSGEFLIIPTFLHALSWMYNPQITSTVNIASYTLRLDVGIIAKILYSCIIVSNSLSTCVEQSTHVRIVCAAHNDCKCSHDRCCVWLCAVLERPCHPRSQPLAVHADRQHDSGSHPVCPWLRYGCGVCSHWLLLRGCAGCLPRSNQRPECRRVS